MSVLMSDAVMVPREAVQRLILAADCYGVRFLDSDDLSDEAVELQDATEAMKDRLAASTPVGGWEDISTAPKDGTPIIGWCVHSANEYHLKDGYLTTYGAHVEGLGHVGDGAHVLEWGGECDGDGDGYIPDWWFRVGSDFEEAANPTHWMPPPPPPSVSTDHGSRPQEAVPTEGHEAAVVADERLIWFLRVIEGAGGEAPAGDGYNVLGAFCDDRGDEDDTYNVSEGLGYTRTMHSGWGDGCATVSITDAGRSFLSAPTPQPADGCSSNEGAGQ